METVRAIFLEASQAGLALMSSSEVATRWQEPSALEGLTIGSLAAHLTRATTNVERYLDAEEPPDPPIGCSEYFAAAVPTNDLDDEVNRGVVRASDEMALLGHAALVTSWAETAERLHARLPAEPEARRVRVFADLVLTLDAYLRTRIVELVVHADDLSESLGAPAPSLPGAAYDIAIGCMVGIGRLRHGDPAVIRALARRERDDLEALRVF